VKKRGRTTFFLLCVLCAAGTALAAGHAGKAPHRATTHAAGEKPARGHHGSPRADPRHAPPLTPSRKVDEQDCTKPVDIGSGNLKCR
jgi:hypothetical protein